MLSVIHNEASSSLESMEISTVDVQQAGMWLLTVGNKFQLHADNEVEELSLEQPVFSNVQSVVVENKEDRGIYNINALQLRLVIIIRTTPAY